MHKNDFHIFVPSDV